MFCKKSWVGGCVAEFIYAEGYSAEHTRQLISIVDNDDTVQNRWNKYVNDSWWKT